MFLQRVGNRGIRLGTLFDRAARRYPGNVMLLDHELDVAPELGRRLTLTEVAVLVSDLASRFWAVGVRKGDRIVIHKRAGFDITLMACAAARIGAVPALLSPHLDGATVAELLRRLEKPYLVTDADKVNGELAGFAFDLTRGVLLAAGEVAGATSLHGMTGVERVPPVPVPPEHPTLITHTSGTTGIPKLAVHTGRSFEARYRPQSAIAKLVDRREPVAIHVSFVHSRMFTAMPIAVLHGHQVLILADDDPDRAAEMFSQMPPGLIEAHPNAFLRWEVLAEHPRLPLANVKYFSSTFDAIHPRTVHRLLQASKRRAPRYMQMYGQSEVGPIAGRPYLPSRGTDADGRCVGFPFPGMTAVRVVPRNGQPSSPSTPGYIEVRSDGRIMTYLGEQERYDRQLTDGWWRMGDVGYRTKRGCLHLLDREVDLIDGIDSTLAVEDALFARLPDLVEVIIVAGEDGRGVPVISTRDDKPLDRRAWDAAVADLPPMADPEQWRLADLPQTGTVKIKRLELAKLLRSSTDAGS